MAGLTRTSGIELGGWQIKKWTTKEPGTDGCPKNGLRLGFASEGWHNDLAQYYYSIFCDGPREIGPIRRTQEYNHSVSEVKMEILANV
jgi:hypothetical protein